MHHTRGIQAAAIALLAVACVSPPVAAAVVAGQVDTFEDGTLQAWQNGGASNPNPATHVATGGPAGTDDAFMRVTSNGGAGSGGKLVVFNTAQWAGDYLAAGVGSIGMQVNNPGTTDLTLRLILVDASAAQSLGTLTGVNLPAGSGWTTVSFSLAPANLSGGEYAAVMDSVTEFNLVHSPGVVAARSSAPNVTAQLGVDNVTAVAVPEPGVLGLAAVALTAITGRRARLRTRRRARSA